MGIAEQAAERDDGSWFAANDGDAGHEKAEEILRLRVALYEIISSRSGKPIAQVEKDCDRNKWLDARETVAYGLADSILERMAPPK